MPSKCNGCGSLVSVLWSEKHGKRGLWNWKTGDRDEAPWGGQLELRNNGITQQDPGTENSPRFLLADVNWLSHPESLVSRATSMISGLKGIAYNQNRSLGLVPSLGPTLMPLPQTTGAPIFQSFLLRPQTSAAICLLICPYICLFQATSPPTPSMIGRINRSSAPRENEPPRWVQGHPQSAFSSAPAHC